MKPGTILNTALSALLTALFVVTPLAAADDRDCIVNMNSAGEKVARAQGKENYSCVKAAAKGKEGAPATCITADDRGRVAAKRRKTVAMETDKCSSAPAYGYTNSTTVNMAATDEDVTLLFDTFGSDLDAALLGYDDRNRAKCQAAVVKAAEKILKAKLQTFGLCKKAGLSAGSIRDATTLQACFDDVSSDAKGKIDRALGRLTRALPLKCGGVNLDSAFPGTCAGETDFAGCVDRLVECRACRMLDTMDALSRDCDLFDDGLPNASCAAPSTTTTTTTTTSTSLGSTSTTTLVGGLGYPVVDTGQTACYDDSVEIAPPLAGQAFYGQDAQHAGNTPSYTLSGDGLTVLDNVTGLVWTKDPDLDGDGDIDAADKLSFAAAQSYAAALNSTNFGGYSGWRLPGIKELYSLIDFDGLDVSSPVAGSVPFIDTNYFDFAYGDLVAGERIIDAQYWSSTEYVSTTMNGDHTVFGVNFADGRIKGYGTIDPAAGGDKTEYVRYVRGNPAYGINDFSDNGDGTINDNATGLMWTQADSGAGMNWENALAWVQQNNTENHLGYSDWRLPDAKELQSIVDYSRSPATSGTPAIDPLFTTTTIVDEGGTTDYPFYWASTTHANGSQVPGTWGVYLAFGTAYGFMESPPNSGNYNLLDVHGAGSQRSDPKNGDPAGYPNGNGPQGDVIRVYNYVRMVR